MSLPTRPSVMQHQFNQVPEAEIQRSSFNRDHGYKTTFNAGLLVPIFVDEVLPGDTFNLNMTAFARLATPIFPIMDNMFLNSFFFFVPNRLIWKNWQHFNGEQDNPGDSTDYLVPRVGAGGYSSWTTGSLGDYFGLPIGVSLQANALWFRAYNLIWNQWFRDQNLQDAVPVPTDDGPDLQADYAGYGSSHELLLRRGKRHDYFTSCLPWPQKGPAVSIPLGSTAPVVFPNQLTTHSDTIETLAGPIGPFNIEIVPPSLGTDGFVQAAGSGGSSGNSAILGVVDSPINGVYANLATATATTINALRLAFQMQKLYERDARGGTRYTEIIRSHFGVISPDARLQRPEYLGGGQTMVNIHPIAQTSATGSGTPQGNLAGFGTAQIHGHGFTKSFVEHGVIIGMVSVRADLTYQQGMNRMFSRQTRFDFYWPALSHIGEQAVLNKEIYAQGSGNDNLVFGYQEAWAEYRYKPSLITGQFRSTAPDPLDSWHLSQDFGSLPTLSEQFIEDNPPVARVIAVNSEPHFIFDAYFNLRCARPMPIYSVPGLIDHF